MDKQKRRRKEIYGAKFWFDFDRKSISFETKREWSIEQKMITFVFNNNF